MGDLIPLAFIVQQAGSVPPLLDLQLEPDFSSQKPFKMTRIV
jgi:hypothetical protein